MEYDQTKRMAFGDYVDKFFASLLIAVCAYGVNTVSSKLENIQSDLKTLNKNLAVTINQVANQKEAINDLKVRVLRLERRN